MTEDGLMIMESISVLGIHGIVVVKNAKKNILKDIIS